MELNQRFKDPKSSSTFILFTYHPFVLFNKVETFSDTFSLSLQQDFQLILLPKILQSLTHPCSLQQPRPAPRPCFCSQIVVLWRLRRPCFQSCFRFQHFPKSRQNLVSFFNIFQNLFIIESFYLSFLNLSNYTRFVQLVLLGITWLVEFYLV